MSKIKKNQTFNDFKIYNFCSNNYLKEFKAYYNLLNNNIYVSYFVYYLALANSPQIKSKITVMIKENKTKILESMKKANIVIKYYEQNDSISKSEIGKFFEFYKKSIKDLDLKKDDDLLILFYKLINYGDLISILKECFYIFSDQRACVYHMTPSINFYKTKKETIEKVILTFRDNQNMLSQIISKIYLGDENPWGSRLYSSAYAMFETLNIIGLYFKDPLKQLQIKFSYEKSKIKKSIDKNLLKDLFKKYDKVKLLNHNLSITDRNGIINVSGFIIKLKKLGYDLWFVIPLVFDVIFLGYKLLGIQEANVYGMKEIINQKKNNILGVMCYLLNKHDYISNTNIFKNFND
jgi:hypothetical protein